MNYNPDMRLQEDNHLAIARPFLQPGVACFMPRAFMCGSQLPDWKGTTVFFLATPKLGAKFIECTLEISKDGGSIGRIENKYENYMFVLEGSIELTLYGKRHTMEKHGYFWAPPGSDFELVNKREETARVLWVRKIYVPTPYFSVPQAIVSNINDVKGIYSVDGIEQRCLPLEDDRGFDMAMNLITFEPGVTFTRVESHICEHGNYFVSGRGFITINGRFVEVYQDDFCYVAPYTPHTAAGLQPEPMSYLLYKNINREFTL